MNHWLLQLNYFITGVISSNIMPLFKVLVLLLYFKLHLAYSNYSGGQHKVLVGSQVELPCNTSLPSSDDAISLIFWYKGDAIGLPVYSVDARNSTLLDQAKHFTSPIFKDRILFNLTVQPAYLTISNIKEEDDGEYRCRVDFRWARTINTIVNVQVIEPPTKMEIKDESNQNVHGTSSLYNEGSDLRLTCFVYGGKPSPVIHWYSDNALIDDTFSNKVDTDGLVSINELYIPKLNRKDLNKAITCVAANNNLTHSLNKTIHLDISLYPLFVKITSIRRPLSADKLKELKCISRGSRPPAKITWFLGNKQLTNSSERYSKDNNETQNVLNFVPSFIYNGASLICKAENLRLPNSPIQDQWPLSIYYKPKVNLYSRSNIELKWVKEKDEIIFECEIDSNPMIIEAGWLFNGAKLLSDVKNGLILDNTTLVIKVIERKHSGNYSCYASNIEGTGYSQMLNLTVNYAPICATQHQSFYLTALNTSSQIKCKVEAEPSLVTFFWKFNDTVLNEHEYQFYNNHLESEINFSWSNFSDYGTLSCVAQNKVGNQLMPCLFTLLPAGPPDPLVNCAVSNQTRTSLTLSCEPGFNGGLKQTFILKVYDNQKINLLLSLKRTSYPIFMITNLTSFETYILEVFSSNLKGNSNITRLVGQTISMEKQQSGSSLDVNFKSYLAIFSGLCLAFLLVSVIFIIILIIRNRERRKDSKPKACLPEISSIDCKEPDVVPLQFGSLGKEEIALNYNISIPEMVADLNLLDSELKQSELGTYQLGVLADINSKYCLSKLVCISDDYGFTQMAPQNSFQEKIVENNETDSNNFIPISTQV